MKDTTTVTSAALRQAVCVLLEVVDEHGLDEDVAQAAADGLERICKKYVGASVIPSSLEGRDALAFLADELTDINADTDD
jgi:hypothetical protein